MKKVKDPIYGYIEFDEFYWGQVIDTPEFQRLRKISQTGYSALFPSAHHNRFVHSLGVAHLGLIGFESFKENVSSQYANQDWVLLQNTFFLACLLHDVGHSPFSHSGEKYYEEAIGEDGIRNRLCELIDSEGFSKDLAEGNYGKPHEAMSAIIGLWLCRNKVKGLNDGPNADQKPFDPEFFVRAITGLKYSAGNKVVENALIELLNGEYIDVDKLDYIMRDSFTTGYNSLLIDYQRLLSGYTLVVDEDGKIKPGFQKKSISVIENVVYAKDLERKWVQMDPTIMYDNRIIEYLIREFSKKSKQDFPQYGVFVENALTSEGIGEHSGHFVKLLCDDDIVAYAKNESESEAAKQFFDRSRRLKPMWKTELEYRFSIDHWLSSKELSKWDRMTKLLAEELKNGSWLSVNDEYLSALESDISLAEEKIAFYAGEDADDAKKRYEGILKRKTQIREFCRHFKSFIDEKNESSGLELDFEFFIIRDSAFLPDYDFEKLDSILINVGVDRPASMGDAASIDKKVVRSKRDEEYCFVYTTVRNKTLCPDLTSEFWEYMSHSL